MFKLSCFSIAALILLQAPHGVAQTAAPAASAAQQTLAARIDATLGAHYKADQPGATVIVVQDGKPLLRKAYGLANVDKKQALEPGMQLRLGSITKQFTAAAILLLADQGKLSVTDEITKFLPDYPTQGRRITVEHLLTHTSGIVSYTSKPGFLADSGKDLGVAQMIASFKDEPMQFAPGERHAYNNSGYFLLGAIVEKVSGQSYASFLAQHIFEPLGMKDTAYEGHERSALRRVEGYRLTGKEFAPSPAISMSQPYAAGALVSTVDDMARWDAAIGAGRLLKPATWKQAFTPYRLGTGKTSDYGYGFAIGKLQGHDMVAHGGGINGFSTYALRLPAARIYVAVLSNADYGIAQPEMVASKAAAIALGKPLPQHRAIALDPKALDAFAGTYRIDERSNAVVKRQGEQLVLQRSGGASTVITPHSENGFFVENRMLHFEFARNAQGEVTQVTAFRNGTQQTYPRVAE